MLTISRKEVVDIFVTETVRATVQCWTVGQLRAVDFLCWFVFFGTILEKSLHFFLSCTCTADAVMALSTEKQGQEVWLSVCAQKIFHFSLILFWGKFSGTDQRNFSVSFNWYNLLFFFTLRHHNSWAGHMMSLLSSKHSPFRTAKWIICFVSAGFGACVGAVQLFCAFLKRILRICSLSKLWLSSGISATAIIVNSIINVLC